MKTCKRCGEESMMLWLNNVTLCPKCLEAQLPRDNNRLLNKAIAKLNSIEDKLDALDKTCKCGEREEEKPTAIENPVRCHVCEMNKEYLKGRTNE